MSEVELLKREVDGLSYTIGQHWIELASRQLSPEERTVLRNSVRTCTANLTELLKKLDDSVGELRVG
jgi:hypothetical protein